MIDGYPECDEVGLYFTSLSRFSSMHGWLVDNRGIVTQILPQGNCSLGFSTSGLCLGGRFSAGRLFYLDVFVRLDKDISHLSDVVLH